MLGSEPIIYFPTADRKYEYWAKELIQLDIQTKILNLYSIKSLVYLFSMTKERDRYFVIRYLNDSPSRFKTVLQLFFITVFCICVKSRGFKIWWFCHNIDAETYVWYPTINACKRKIVKLFCDKIFVMDRYLVEPAREILGVGKRIVSICFGEFSRITKFGSKLSNENKLRDFINSDSFKLSKVKVICVTSHQPKNKSVQLFKKVMNQNECVGVLIYDGKLDIRDYTDDEKKLLIINEKHDVPKSILDEFTHMVKCSHDLSMNLSIYAASSSGLILVSDGSGVLKNLICDKILVGEISDDGRLQELQEKK